MRNVGEDGLCSDMCPEKERYLRENQRRLSPFEVLSSGNKVFDHSRAVKEYIRSSADQDMPPPEELRPANVLEMTMDYLLSDVINKGGPGMWGEWYNFLWNRMRAIRKDIVQQRLCNERAVQLTEKSTRFHILCSAMLCEEDPSVFDQKINSENLTKCLQSLKELYHDLSLKGIHCCHEAEFRGYMILMNLNNADILSEAQHWPEHILRSEFVVRSIAVHTAVTSNNYVKFFRIVRQSSFLTSCILHRYFNQMRMVAVKRVAKAFYPSASPGIIMVRMMEQLGYDNMNDFNELLTHFNLSPQMSNINRTTNTFDCIIINGRSNRIVESEQVLPARKSFTLVECKITSSLGEVRLFVRPSVCLSVCCNHKSPFYSIPVT
ncbi:hypothetical protein HELRODRAFT_80342 [Helobdella robusta]|uniref:Germinal-center associated nuclear protein n=1 Tax=Helobdella robusta TaxID=6412 RepID=T1G3Z7_HELRO|nr:hypothetical protein HELRODRAFT_80342 [Helobdella robusta]ESO03260.1 hypothetical protein HELRODRAFT_80342 [Helobdella robusta]